MEQLLIIEDDLDLNRGLCRSLKAENRIIVSCLNLKEAREQILCQIPSLVLLDLNLPDGNGLSLLRTLKEEHPLLPVILLTANDTDMDIVEGLNQGADDYITKPFSLSVLRARVNAQLRRLQQQSASQKNTPYQSGHYHFDFEHMIFRANGKPAELSKTEQKLLRLLVENRGMTLSRSHLLEKVWNDGLDYVDENTLSVAIKRLRDKLGAQKDIKTIYGIGYSWVKNDES